MTAPAAPAQSLPVLAADQMRVSHGANLGDAISFAAELVLDDVYVLGSQAQTRRLALLHSSSGSTIAPDSEIGTPGEEIIADAVLTFMSPDGATTDAIVLVELDQTGHVANSYLLPLVPLVPKLDYTLVTIDTDAPRARLASVACVAFTRGTRITMATGMQKPIEELRPGDRLLTRDAGVQTLRWVGESTARARGEFAPICITAGTLNNTSDLIVAPDHRLFIYQRLDRLGAGRSELMVKARHLVNGDTVRVLEGGYIDYFQLLFDDHYIIYAEGIAAESFLIDARTAPALPDAVRATAHDAGLSDLDVQETLLNRPDAAELLGRASRR